MEPRSPTITARRLVREAVSESGLADPGDCFETVLIKQGYCVGRRFSFDAVYALWLEKEATIEIYEQGGKLLRTMATDWRPATRKAA